MRIRRVTGLMEQDNEDRALCRASRFAASLLPFKARFYWLICGVVAGGVVLGFVSLGH